MNGIIKTFPNINANIHLQLSYNNVHMQRT